MHSEQDNEAKYSTNCCHVQRVQYDDNRHASDKQNKIQNTN